MSAITSMTSRLRQEQRLEGDLFFCSDLVADGDFYLALLKKSSLETGTFPASLTRHREKYQMSKAGTIPRASHNP